MQVNENFRKQMIPVRWSLVVGATRHTWLSYNCID